MKKKSAMQIFLRFSSSCVQFPNSSWKTIGQKNIDTLVAKDADTLCGYFSIEG